MKYYNDLTTDEKAQRALDYFEIQKVMAAHAYCYRAEQQRFEVDNFWSRTRDDISYGHGEIAYEGREEVYHYYVEGNEKMNEAKLGYFSEMWPEIENKPENLGIGDLVLRVQGTPYIEIARDGKTAKGIWTVPGISSELDKNGEPRPFFLMGKEFADFIKEEDGWKILHFNATGDIGFEFSGDLMLGRLNKHELTDRTVPGQFPKPNKKVELDFATHYTPKTSASFAPPLPEPYETWDDSMSYTKGRFFKDIQE